MRKKHYLPNCIPNVSMSKSLSHPRSTLKSRPCWGIITHSLCNNQLIITFQSKTRETEKEKVYY